MIVKSMGLEKYKKWLIYSFSIPYHIRKISICSETPLNTRKIKGSECGSKSRQIEHLSLSILHRLTQSQNASKINAYRDMLTE